MFDGADEVIDYNAQDFVRVVSNCDAVFDMVGGEARSRLRWHVRGPPDGNTRALQSSVPIWRGRSSSMISPMTLTNNARISTLLSIHFVVRLET
jgi:hypothetical protein